MSAIYYGETCWHLRMGAGEHLGVSPLTGKKSKTKKSTAVKDHHIYIFCDHIVSIEDIIILATSDSEFQITVKESLLISHDEPILNKNETSIPLYLFE